MILTKYLPIALNYATRKYYANKGYDVADKKQGHLFMCAVKDIPDKSSAYRVVKKCDSCGDVSIVTFSVANRVCKSCSTGKFKSGKAHPNYVNGGVNTCIDCGTQISRSKPYKRCRSCFGKSNSGKDNYRWRDDRENMVARNGNMHRWAFKVKDRDCYCDICASEADLEAHHLNSVVDNKEHMYDVDNGIALCKSCHTEFHVRYGYGYNTEKQYLEFKEIKHGLSNTMG
jgi:hypothetical protein